MAERTTKQPDLADIIDKVGTIRKSINMNCEKLQVALTGVFRLMNGDKTEILSSLGGRQEDLKAYAVKLVSELRRDADDQFTHLQNQLGMLLEKNLNHE